MDFAAMMYHQGLLLYRQHASLQYTDWAMSTHDGVRSSLTPNSLHASNTLPQDEHAATTRRGYELKGKREVVFAVG